MADRVDQTILKVLLNPSDNPKNIAAFGQCIGKEISGLAMTNDDKLKFDFTDGAAMVLFDNGQSCCEDRYMTTDDELQDFVGATLLGAKAADYDEVPAGEDVHEIAFLHIATSKGVFTMQTHNKHNGCYGGFDVVTRMVK
jgi:hypothetical protein